MLEFVAWVIAEALGSAFVLSLWSKWGIIEWLQVHARTDWQEKLFSCKFCCSWWVCVANSLILYLATGRLELLGLPVFATVITRELW